MILRRVIEHVKEQNWTAIVLDFVIVVLGVFIGIQVANWNDAQASKRLGKDYEARLANDLAANLEDSKYVADYYRQVLAAVLETDQLLASEEPDPIALITMAYRASEITNLPPRRATWDQIVSSGHLNLLPQALIDAGLAEYYVVNMSEQTYLIVEKSEYRHTIRKILPISVQKAIREGCSDVRNDVGDVIGFMDNCELDINPALIADLAEKLMGDPELQTTLRFQYSNMVSATLNQDGDIALVEKILGVLSKSAE